MKIELKALLSKKKTPLMLSFLCLISGIICCLVGEIALPLTIAFLAALYLFDTESGHKYSYLTSFLLLVINVGGFLLGICLSAFSLASIILAIIMVYACRRDHSKADTAYVMTILCAAFSLVGYILLAMTVMQDYSFDAATEFYTRVTDTLRTVFVETLLEAYNTAGLQVTGDMITEIFDSQISMVISYLLIVAFAIVGLSFKLFGFVVSKRAEDSTEFKSWRFIPTKLYAYFYIILTFVSIFIVSNDSVFSVTVNNLYNIFMFIFAYVGFKTALDILRKKLKPVTSVILLVIGCALLFSFAVQLLAVLGALYIVRTPYNEKNLTQ